MVREKLSLPEGGKKLLLHSCCAPCSGEVMEAIIASGIEFSIFFYNFNIHPICRDIADVPYSLRDTNKWRMENGREKITLVEKYYGKE